ncbi:MAG: spore maturation protein A [Clostridiales bacterium]|jgi:spore maturation protein A|nr:spore maturation protein A [Clostridiales bacterium]
MMNLIWAALLVISFVCAIVTGRMPELSQAVLDGAENAVGLVIATLGMMCVWTGLMKIAEEGGLTSFLAKLFSPIFCRLFPDYEKDSPAAKAICMNLTANILGLGNAATPLGIAAMEEMQAARSNPLSRTANNSMVMFVVMNTASIQLIPTFMGTLRAKYGSAAPFDILPAVWFASIISLIVGILVAKVMQGRRERERDR